MVLDFSKEKECNWIKEKIKETVEALEKTEIGIATAEAYSSLIEIHGSLWSLLYFKLNQEENYLKK